MKGDPMRKLDAIAFRCMCSREEEGGREERHLRRRSERQLSEEGRPLCGPCPLCGLRPLGLAIVLVHVVIVLLLVLVVVVRMSGVHNGSLLVVDLLRLLITNQQQDGPHQEDGRAPADAVGPAKVPVRSIRRHRVRVMQFAVEEGRIEGQRNNDRQHWWWWWWEERVQTNEQNNRKLTFWFHYLSARGNHLQAARLM